MKRVIATGLLLSVLFSPATIPTHADDGYALGFKTLYNLIPDVVGPCAGPLNYNPDNGDGIQLTANGMMVWRKADNWTAFTNGFETWINGPYGLQHRPNTSQFDWEQRIVVTCDNVDAYVSFANTQTDALRHAIDQIRQGQSLSIHIVTHLISSDVDSQFNALCDAAETELNSVLDLLNNHACVPDGGAQIHEWLKQIAQTELDSIKLLRQAWNEHNPTLFGEAMKKGLEATDLAEKVGTELKKLGGS